MYHEPRISYRHSLDLCGPYLQDDHEPGQVRCYLQMARTNISLDLPADVLAEFRSQGDPGMVILQIPNARPVRVDVVAAEPESQANLDSGWLAEMEDCDRF